MSARPGKRRSAISYIFTVIANRDNYIDYIARVNILKAHKIQDYCYNHISL